MSKDRIETALIDTPNEVDVSYWDGEWCNEEEIRNGLIDEATVLTIATQRVKDRILSISQTAKNIEDTNKGLREKLYTAEKEISDLKNKLDKSEESVEVRALEILKEVERTKYGYAIGDDVYIVRTTGHWEDVECPVCKGKGKIEVNGYEIKCPKCVNGKNSEWIKDGFEIIEATICDRKVRIEGYVNGYWDSFGVQELIYKTKSCDSKYGSIDEYIKHFKTKEDAEKFIQTANPKQI